MSHTKKLVSELNASGDVTQIRNLLGKITGNSIDESTRLFSPFHISLGKCTRIGKNVFINSDCSFFDMGGITIEDGVIIGPKVSLVTEYHLRLLQQSQLGAKPIRIKQNAFIGAGAIILPGITIGENSVVAAGALVSKDIPDNTFVEGVPAEIIKTI